VPLTLQKFEDLTEDEKNEHSTNSIQRYVVYLEELKEKGKRAAMKRAALIRGGATKIDL
jgi:hypothetical protein